MSNLEALLKKYKGAIELGNVEKERTWFSLGPLSLNMAIGNPRGIKSGRIVQIVGKYSSGKSTLALDIIAQHQRDTGLPVAYVDFERAYDKNYAEALGVNTEKLYRITADSTETGLNITEGIMRSGDVKLVVLDSIAAAKPSSENEKDYNDSAKMASSAGIITRFCNRAVNIIDDNDILLVVLNQLRANFNTMSPEKEIPFGGKALHYATSVMIQMTPVKNGEDIMEVQAAIKKNRVGAPRHVTKFNINNGRGIDHARDIIDLAIERDIVIASGAWLSYRGAKVQGKAAAGEQFPINEIRAEIINQETSRA